MSKRRISNIEYQPGKYRQISNVAANVEYRPGKYRQISNVALMVEYEPYGSMVQNSLNSAVDAVRNALSADPDADISSLVASYKSAIEAAFGITFDVDGGDNWVFISLHFARQGLEAVARAFEAWAESKAASQGLNIPIDRFDLFKRVYGGITIKNVADIHDDRVAETLAPNIVVYKQTDGDQWYMTPNNLVHELGHLFDGKAGFGIKYRGSLYYTLDDSSKGGGTTRHDGYSRKGMAEGKEYLRQRSLEHATINDAGNNVASYTAFNDPLSSDPAYSSFVPQRYLFYDIAYNRYDVWLSPVYHNRYGDRARIDTLVQNETADATETAADAFLNWVRHWERPTYVNKSGETQAAGWINFFEANMACFCGMQ